MNETLRFHTFVANIISLIREATATSQWKYINTKLNPADYASRGLAAESFLKCETWINGPLILKKPEDKWPEFPDALKLVNDSYPDDPEVKKEKFNVNPTIATDLNGTSKLVHHYSDWRKLKRAVAWFLQVKHLLLLLSKKRNEVLTSTQAQEPNRINLIEKEMRVFKDKEGSLDTSLSLCL